MSRVARTPNAWLFALLILTAAAVGLIEPASPARAQNAASPTPVAELTPTIPPEFNNNPLGGTEGDFDSRALGISLMVGLVFAFGLYLVWRLVRPDNPTFGGRSRDG